MANAALKPFAHQGRVTNQMVHSVLQIQELVLACHLGCSIDEQKTPQEVRVSVRIEFAAVPDACLSDSLNDTVCYAQLCSQLTKAAAAQSFATVEHLARQLSLCVQEPLPPKARWQLTVHKIQPPVPGLKSGVTFQLGTLN